MKIEVINVSESTIAKTANTGKRLRFISNELYPTLSDESLWKIVVGRDVIVPIINSKNPFLDKIYQQGISTEEFAQIFENPEIQHWGTLLKNSQNEHVNYYMIDDESINSVVANFLNVNQITFDGIKVENEKELISSIQKDPYALGFCKMINIIDFSDYSIVENIKLLPIDRNKNGNLDHIESIYDDLNALSRGVWIGKYPPTLFNNIYAISSVQPTDEIEVEFLKWVLTDGQQFLNPTGYSELVYSERQRKLDILLYNEIDVITAKEDYAVSKLLIIISMAFIVTVFIVTVTVRHKKSKRYAVQNASSIYPLVFDENSVEVPKGLYFDKTHTWAFMEKNGVVRIGIDDFLQHITGPLTNIKMENPGKKIKKGEQLLSIIHKGKQLHVNAPISGTIKAQNEILKGNSSLINSSPYSDGWVYTIEPTNWLREIRFLSMEKKYKEWLKSEFSRLKDFLAITLKPNNVEYAYSVLQDGGELKDGILADLGPEVWEDFQTNFIDTSK
ncbi:MAG: hypothetical protein H8E34_06540 [Bacteroidetes bacterium]|nr:hypothetical protein [Bacteroidota bacterium]